MLKIKRQRDVTILATLGNIILLKKCSIEN